jgi:plastocyanin
MAMKAIRCAERDPRQRPVRMAVLAIAVVSFGLAVWTAPAASIETKANTVSIVNFQFTPAEVTIAPGESVTWVNDDGAPHGLEYHDGSAGKDLLLPGASYNRRFDQPGTYDYNCSVHPYMTGRVIVRPR